MQNSKITDDKERNEFFDENWGDAQRQFIGMSLIDNWDEKNAKMLVQAVGHLMLIINDMRDVDKRQQAEIASLKACMNMKEQG